MGLDAKTLYRFRVVTSLNRIEVLKTYTVEQLNAQVEETGQTLLIAAAMAGNGATMGVLLKEGVDPNIADNKGRTPLIHAVLINNIPVVSALLQHKDINVAHTDMYGKNALDYAIQMRWSKIEPLLLEANQRQAESPAKKQKLTHPDSDTKRHSSTVF